MSAVTFLNFTTVPQNPFPPLLVNLDLLASNIAFPGFQLQRYILSALLGLCLIFVVLAIIFRWKNLWFFKMTPSGEDGAGHAFLTPNSVACWLLASFVFLIGRFPFPPIQYSGAQTLILLFLNPNSLSRPSLFVDTKYISCRYDMDTSLCW